MKVLIATLGLAALWGPAASFAPPPGSKISAGAGIDVGVPPGSSSAIAMSDDFMDDPYAPVRRSYIETSRQFRRTRFGVDDWLKHRSPDRFYKNLKNVGTSGLYRGIIFQMSAVLTVATFVWGWNLFLADGFTLLNGAHVDGLFNAPVLKLPLTPFTLASPSLGLLLVFRTNTAYKRWDEARKCWGLTINNSRNVARMGTAWINEPNEEVRQRKLDKLAKCIWAFPRSLARHMLSPYEAEADYVADLRERLSPEHADGLIAAAHRPNRALQDLARAVNDLPMHALRRNEIDKSLVTFEDQLGGSERLFSSPVPLFYTRHTSRFLSVWMLLLPFALYEPFGSTYNHLGMLPCSLILALFLFGIEELSVQLEEPFSILPMVGYSTTIGQNAEEIVTWSNIYDNDPVKAANDRVASVRTLE